MFTKDTKKRNSLKPLHSAPVRRSITQQRQENDQALTSYLEANAALKNFLRVYGQQLPPETATFNNGVRFLTEEQALHRFFRNYGNPFLSVQNLPHNTPVPLRKKIISLVLCFAIVLSQLISGNVILLPLALGLLSRIQISSAQAVEASQAIAPIVQNPYTANLAASRMRAPQNLVTECHSISLLFYRPKIAKSQNHPKTVFCIRSANQPQLSEESYQAAAQDIAAIFQSNKNANRNNLSVYNILAKFPVRENIRLGIMQKAYDLLQRAYDFLEEEFYQEQHTVTDDPYHFDEVSSSKLMIQAEEQNLDFVAELLRFGVPLSADSQLILGKRLVLLNDLLKDTEENTNTIDLLFQSGVDINVADMAYNPLLNAVVEQNKAAIDRLLVLGADTLIRDDENRSPYRAALKIGDLDTIAKLTKAAQFPGDNPFIVAYNQWCTLALANNEKLQMDVYQILVNVKLFNIHIKDRNGNNLLHVLLASKISLEAKKRLLRIAELVAPELIATANDDGKNPLRMAQFNLDNESGFELTYSIKTYITDDHKTLRQLMPDLHRLMATYRKLHPEPPFLERLVSGMGLLVALGVLLLLLGTLITVLFKRKPKEAFVHKGIYCTLTFTEIAKYKYEWQLKLLPREEVCERHKQFPAIPLRFVGISDEELKQGVANYFNNTLKNNVYYSRKDLAEIRATVGSLLFSAERSLIIKTEIYQQTQASRASEKRLDKEASKLECIINDYLAFLNELDSYDDENYDLPYTNEQSNAILSILEDLNQLKKETYANLQEFKKAFLATSSILTKYHELVATRDFKKIGFELWQLLKPLEPGELENLKQNTNLIISKRNSYTLETNRFLYDLRTKFEKEVLKLENKQSHAAGLKKTFPATRHSASAPVKYDNQLRLTQHKNPKALEPKSNAPVRMTTTGNLVQTFFNRFRSPTNCDSKSIKISDKSNDELIGILKNHLEVLTEQNNRYASFKNDQQLRPIYIYAMRFHMFQISHCALLIKRKHWQNQIAKKEDQTAKEVRNLLGHHGYLIEDDQEVAGSVESALASFNKALEAKELTFAGSLLHDRSKQLAKKDDNRSVVELKKTMMDLLQLIFKLKEPITFLRSEEAWRKDALKMLLMEFAECNRCLRRFHNYTWKNGLRDKIESYYMVEGRLNHLLRAVRHGHEPRTPEFTDENLAVLVESLFVMNCSVNLIAVIKSIDHCTRQLSPM